jgi:hypothetical protein
MVQQAPAAVLAAALGAHRNTAVRHAKTAGADYASYPGSVDPLHRMTAPSMNALAGGLSGHPWVGAADHHRWRMHLRRSTTLQWAARPTAPTYCCSEVGSLTLTTAKDSPAPSSLVSGLFLRLRFGVGEDSERYVGDWLRRAAGRQDFKLEKPGVAAELGGRVG